jgi:hypothetical protein
VERSEKDSKMIRAKRGAEKINPSAIVLLIVGTFLIILVVIYGIHFLKDMKSNVSDISENIDKDIVNRLRETRKPLVLSSQLLEVSPYKTKNLYLLVKNELRKEEEFKFNVNCKKALISDKLGDCGSWVTTPFPVRIKRGDDVVLKIPFKAETEKEESYLYEILIYTDEGYKRSLDFYVNVK